MKAILLFILNVVTTSQYPFNMWVFSCILQRWFQSNNLFFSLDSCMLDNSILETTSSISSCHLLHTVMNRECALLRKKGNRKEGTKKEISGEP